MKIQLKDSEEFQKMLLLKGLSQRDFSKKLNVSPPYLNQIIKMKRNPSARIAKQIVELLGVNFEDIFFITNACKSYHSIKI